MTEQMSFADGKYTVINDNGNLTALRHGEPWKRDLTGDNLVYWMLVESLELKRQRDELLRFAEGVVRYGGNSIDDYLADKAREAIAKVTN